MSTAVILAREQVVQAIEAMIVTHTAAHDRGSVSYEVDCDRAKNDLNAAFQQYENTVKECLQ